MSRRTLAASWPLTALTVLLAIDTPCLHAQAGLDASSEAVASDASAPLADPPTTTLATASPNTRGSSINRTPDTAQLPARIGALPLDAQVRWLQQAARAGTLEQLDDTQLVALFEALDPLALGRYIEAGPNGYTSCEFTMRREERIHGAWPARPDHMLVRLSHEPLRIYARWLPDGAHAGQEVLYDASKRRDELYGHLGGLFSPISIWAGLNGTLAQAQSRHRLTDLGTEYIARSFIAEGQHFAEAGITKPARIEAQTIDGVRVIAFTYASPPGASGFYAQRETLGLDLRHPWFRTIESYDEHGQLFERIVFEQIEPKSFDALTFDPKNPDYRF